MESLICKNCFAPILRLDKGYWFCDYCGSTFLATKEEQLVYSEATSFSASITKPTSTSPISISDDIERLLQKCSSDKKNARKYANLILDIDPDNTEALKYLK